MSIDQLDHFHSIKLKPIISYPCEAEVGESYLMAIDLQLETPNATWPFPEEEYVISFLLNTAPFFSYQPLKSCEPSLVLHRFGGTYGPAQFLLTAAPYEIARGRISIIFVNRNGIPLASVELECEVKHLKHPQAILLVPEAITTTDQQPVFQEVASPAAQAELADVSVENMKVSPPEHQLIQIAPAEQHGALQAWLRPPPPVSQNELAPNPEL